MCDSQSDGSCVWSLKGCHRLIYWHAMQSGRSFEESLYDELKGKWDMHGADDLDICISDINRHGNKHVDEIDGVHGGYGIGPRNSEGKTLLEFCLEKEICV